MKKHLRAARKALKHHFIPHKGNKYHPHILRPKSAVWYGGLLIGMKAVVVAYAVFLPVSAFLAPDVLAAQVSKMVALTNSLRAEKGIPTLAVADPLRRSAQDKAYDMADLGYFSHQSPSGLGLSDFLKREGYHYSEAGENLAMGFSDAETLVDAWMRSPSHYANLVDPDFTEFGIGIEEGKFDGKPTVYVAQHFGLPIPKEIPPPTEQIALASAPVAAPKPAPKPTLKSPTPVVKTEGSSVRWKDLPEGKTRIEVKAVAQGDVALAKASVEGYPVDLKADATSSNTFVGSITIAESSDALFQTVVAPTVTLVNHDGASVPQTVEWEHPKVVSQTPWDKYVQAQSWFSVVPSVFSLSHEIYTVFLVLFSAVLVFALTIELRKQRPHVVMSAFGLFLMVFILWKF